MATVTLDLPIDPLPLQDASVIYGGYDLRLVLGAMYNRTGRIGLGDSLTLLPRLAGANWSVDVQAGQAIIAGNTGSGTYAPERYLVTLAARTNIALTGFNLAPAGTRNHGVYIVVDDANYSGAVFGGRIIVVEDTTGSGPTAPTGFQFKIGTVTIAPAQSNISAANLATTMARASRATPITALTYATGYATYVSGTIGQAVSYSVDGNTVRLQGTAYRTAGDMAAGITYTVGTLPTGYRPAYSRITAGVTIGPVAFRCVITTSGDIQVTPIGTAIAYAAFDGITFELF